MVEEQSEAAEEGQRLVSTGVQAVAVGTHSPAIESTDVGDSTAGGELDTAWGRMNSLKGIRQGDRPLSEYEAR